MKNYPKCIDCKKPLNDYNAKRCQSCAQKERLKNPINHPGYKVLIIWQHEFKKKKILINKILKFNNRRK